MEGRWWRAPLAVAASLCLFSLLGAGVSRAALPAETSADPVDDPPGPALEDPAREVVGLRNATSRTFRQEDGSYAAYLFAGPVNFEDAAGRWQPIDNTLVASSRSGYAVENKANRYVVSVPSSLRGGPVRFGVGQEWITFQLRSVLATADPIRVNGQKAVFEDALAGVSVDYEAGNLGVKETLTLAGPSAPTRFVFDLRASAGLSARETASGGIDLVDTGGAVVFGFAPPYMADSSGTEEGMSNAVTLRLGGTRSAPTLTLEADSAWLQDPAREWPVLIDPTVRLDDKFDCFIRNGNFVNTNYCSSPDITVGFDVTKRRGLLEFDLGSIPAGRTIEDAELWLHCHDADGGALANIDLHRVEKQWTDAATWIKRTANLDWTDPGGDFGPTAWAERSTNCETLGWKKWEDPNLKGLVQAWKNDTYVNHGLLLKQRTETVNQFVRFTSIDDPAFAEWPYMRVQFSNGAPDVPTGLTPTGGTHSSSLQPTLAGVYADPDGDAGKLDFELYRTSDNVLVASSGGANPAVSSGEISTWQVPQGALQPGVQYHWKARASDATTSTAWTASLTYETSGDPFELLAPEVLRANGAELRWTRFSGPGFQAYEVHRSLSPGFTPSPSTLLAEIGDVTLTSFEDAMAAPGRQFTYKVAAAGQATNERTVTLPAAGQVTKTFQPPAGQMKATQITTSTNPTATPACANYGGAQAMRVGLELVSSPPGTAIDEVRTHRALLSFNLRDIPAGSTISAATLTLSYPAYSPNPGNIDLSRLTRSWKEGTGAGTCSGDGATWFETDGGVDWTAGGNWVTPVYETLAGKARQAAGVDDYDVKSLLQEWASATHPDFGLIIKRADESAVNGKALIYYADDALVPALRPKLTVTYTDPESISLSPRVAFALPALSSTVGGVVTVRAAASDDGRIQDVKFYLDSTNGTPIGTDTSAPYEASWNTTGATNGAHTLLAVATDDAGNTTMSPGLGMTVDNAAAPTVSITSPSGSPPSVSGTTTVTATATPQGGKTISRVEFFIDGTRFADDATSPYSASWNTLQSTRTSFDGRHPHASFGDTLERDHKLTVRAYDSRGRVGEQEITVRVDNGSDANKFRSKIDLGAQGAADDEDLLPLVVVEAPTGPRPDPEAAGGTQLGDPPPGGGSPFGGGLGLTESETVPPEPCPDGTPLVVYVTNTSTSNDDWKVEDLELRYRWYADTGTVVGEGLASGYFPQTVQAGQTKEINACVRPPRLPEGVERGLYKVRFDIWDRTASAWFWARGNRTDTGDDPAVYTIETKKPTVDHPIVVTREFGTRLGLERYYHYDREDAGAGMSHLVNVATGNSILRWTPFSSTGRGLSTVLDLTYNSLEDHSESPVGNNWSLSISSLARFGNPIDIHPNNADTIAGRSNKWIEVTDGDGTTHRFTDADSNGVYDAPPGVHLFLRVYDAASQTKRWALTRADRVTFFFDPDGYPTSVQDRHGNTITFTLADVPPAEDPGGPKRRITQVLDAGGRAYAIDYYDKNEAPSAHVRGKIQSIADHAGRLLLFDYYDDGNLRRITQKGGTKADGSFLADRSFTFLYTKNATSQSACDGSCVPAEPDAKIANQSVRLFSVRDPRGAETVFDYYITPEDANGEYPAHPQEVSKLRWRLEARTDRGGQRTTFYYDDIDAGDGTLGKTSVGEPLTTGGSPPTRERSFRYDTKGRVTEIEDALDQVTQVEWFTSADGRKESHVKKITEPNGASTAYDYNHNGYPTLVTVRDRTGAAIKQTQLVYENDAVCGPSGPDARDTTENASELKQLVDGRSNTWQFSLSSDQCVRDLLTTTDPEGFSTAYAWNADGTLASLTDPRGVLTPSNPNDFKTSFLDYDPNGLPGRIGAWVDAATTATSRFGYDPDGLLLFSQDPEHDGFSPQSHPNLDPRAYRTVFDYDAFRRPGLQSAPKSTTYARGILIWTAVDYDQNDNVVSEIDAHYGRGYPGTGARTTTAYDAMDRPTLVTGPDTSADPAGERTQLAYDLAGRLTRLTRPNGVQTTSPVDDGAIDYLYDPLDRIVTQKDYLYEGSTFVRTHFTHTCYDQVGNVVSVTPPRAQAASVNCAQAKPTAFSSRYAYDDAHRLTQATDPLEQATSFLYDGNDNVTQVTDPRGKVEERTYDKRDLLLKVKQPFNASRGVTTAFRYDAAGNRITLVSPRAWDASPDPEPNKQTFPAFTTDYDYDGLNRLTRVSLPVEQGGTRAYVHNAYDRNGNLRAVSLPVTAASPGTPGSELFPNVADEFQTDLSFWDPGWIRSSSDHVDPTVSFDYTAQGWQRARTPELPGGELNESEAMRWRYYADGLLKERRDQEGQPTTYTYDANNNLTKAIDVAGLTDVTSASNQKRYEIHAVYDSLDELTGVLHRQSTSEGAAGNYTSSELTYDPNGNLTVRIDDGTRTTLTGTSTGGRKSIFGYDTADWLDFQFENNGTSSCTDDRKIDTDFTPTGWEALRQIYRAKPTCTAPLDQNDPAQWNPKQRTSWTHFDNGKLDRLEIRQGDAGGDLVERHDVTYFDNDNPAVYLNGFRTKDVFLLAGPSATCTASALCTARYWYDARDRLTKYDNGVPPPGSDVLEYVLDPVGNTLTEKKDGSVERTFEYTGTRLDREKDAGGTVLGEYWYDPHGNLDCVTAAAGSQADCPASAQGTPSASLRADYAYDGLDRLLSYRAFAIGTQTDKATYTYDALDRVVKETETHETTGTQTTAFAFLALTNLATTETQTGGASPATKTYGYDAYGHRISFRNVESAQTKDYLFAYDVHGSVSLLLNESDGSVKASYGYTPYGGIDPALTFGDRNLTNPEEPPEDPLNYYRYTGKRLDTGSNTLDMGARRYGPDTARFLQPDLYRGALADLGLTLDPLTGNRYALAGGNPTGFVEVDGHYPSEDGGGASSLPNPRTGKREIWDAARFYGSSERSFIQRDKDFSGQIEYIERVSLWYTSNEDPAGWNPAYGPCGGGPWGLPCRAQETHPVNPIELAATVVAPEARIAAGVVKVGEKFVGKLFGKLFGRGGDDAAEAGAAVAANKSYGDAARDAFARAGGFDRTEKSITTSLGGRRYDVFDEAVDAAYEVKTGYVYGQKALDQIAKDAAALTSRQVQSVEWVFYPSRTGGRWGPSGAVLEALQRAGIPYRYVR